MREAQCWFCILLCIIVLTWPNCRASGGILLSDVKHCMHLGGLCKSINWNSFRLGVHCQNEMWNLPKSWTEHHGSYCCIYLRVRISCLPLALQNWIPNHRNFWWIKPVWNLFLRGSSWSRKCRPPSSGHTWQVQRFCLHSRECMKDLKYSALLQPSFDNYYLRK